MALIAATALAAAARAEAPTLEIQPPSLVLGTGERAKITVKTRRGGRLGSASNIGTLAPSPDSSGPSQEFTYTPPEIRHPSRAVVVFWVEHEQGGVPEATWAEIALVGRLELPVGTQPGARVKVEIAGKTFGPVNADAAGRAQVQVEVPPGASAARVLAESGARATTREIPLPSPPPSPVALFLSPQPMHPERGGWLVVTHRDAQAPADVWTEPGGATLRFHGRSAGGLIYSVTPDGSAQSVRVEGGLTSGPREARSQVEARLAREIPPVPDDLPSPFGQLGRFTHGLWLTATTAGGGWGLAEGISFGFRLPGARERLHLEGALGYRSVRLSTRSLSASSETAATAFPAQLSLRGLLLWHGSWNLHGRAGGGLVPFSHRTGSETQPTYSESALSYELFGGVEASRRWDRLELFLELRGTLAPLRTALLNADASGVGLLAGARFALP